METKDVDRLHIISYNQYRTEKLSFEHGDLPFGTKRMLYNPNKKHFEVWEKGDDAIVILRTTKSGKEAENLYEQIYREKNISFNGYADLFESTKIQGDWDSKLSENGTDGKRDSGKIETERPGNNAGGSGANLPGSNSKESLNLSTRIASDTEYMEPAKEPEDTDVRFSTKHTKEMSYENR